MKHLLHIGIALILLTLATSSSAVCGVAASTSSSAMSRYQDNTSVRNPAVAGSFYPSSASEIRSMLGAWLHPTEGSDAPQAVIVPHAGYVFSGEVAASAFSRITAGHNYKRIFLLGPSHRVGFTGASVDTLYEYAETPLGQIQIDVSTGEELIRDGKGAFVCRRDVYKRQGYNVNQQYSRSNQALYK